VTDRLEGFPEDFHCITCSDEGCPMRVVAVDHDRGLALCEDADGARQSVEVALVEPVAIGDTLLVHAGTALTVVVEARA
jgi:hydrogenase assembly chaperone HypC/HupF